DARQDRNLRTDQGVHAPGLGGTRRGGGGGRAVAEQPPVAPVLEGDQDGQGAAADRGQDVLVAGRVAGVRAAFQDAVVDELVEPFGEDLAGDPEAGAQLVEPVPAAGHVPQQEQAPPVADHVEGLGDGASVVAGTGFAGHTITLYSVSSQKRLTGWCGCG